MKKKIIIVTASVALNLVLFVALVHSTNFNNFYNPTPPAFMIIQHLPAGVVYSPN
jgi:hypothetical protein